MLEALTATTSTLVSKVDKLEVGQAKLEAKVNGLDREITVLTECVSELHKGQVKLEQGQAKLEQGQVKLEQGQAKLEQEVADIKATVARIEVEHDKKFDALFDSYKLLYDVDRELRSDVSVLKSRLDRHDFMLNWHDIKLSRLVK